MRAPSRILFGLLLALALGVLGSGGTAAAPSAGSDDDARWLWPLEGARLIAEPYRAPAHEYGAGHRGVDLSTDVGSAVRAPADGVVAFSGTVVDRPLLTIEHDDGLVSTFEPLLSTLAPGTAVSTGDEIGVVAVGGHAMPGTLHLGVRLDGDYINPMLLFGPVPRAVLLPCCAPI